MNQFQINDPKCWAVHETEDGPIHVVPVNDEQEHELSEFCWCKPDPDALAAHGELYLHHSADCRELIEQAEMIKDSE